MRARRLLFRVDGGPGVGLGHLQRCLSLAAAAASRGAQALFVVNDDRAVRERTERAGWDVHVTPAPSWSAQDLAVVLDVARARAAGAVVVDSDFDPPEYLGAVREAGFFTCAIDDNGSDDVRADLLVNGDAHATEQVYRSHSGRTEWLLGPEYALVAPGFATGITAAAVPARRALLTVGGSDAAGLLPGLLRAIAAAPPALAWEVVIGPFVSSEAGVAESCRELGERVTVTRAPASLREPILRADVVLTAAGQTLYETAALGRPAVAVAVAGNQVPQLAAFVRHGAVLDGGSPGCTDVAAHAVALLQALAHDRDRLAAMAAAGRQFIDGCGAQRVVERMLQLVAGC